MESTNAFIGNTAQPTTQEISAALGPTATVWTQLLKWFAEDQGVTEMEWKSTAPKYGWTLLLKFKKRTIVYLAPCSECFRASFILGDRAVAAANESSLPKPVLKLLKEAPHYSEGTGLRLLVKNAKDLPAIRKLALIKLAH